MIRTTQALIGVLSALVILILITTVPAYAESDAIQEAKDREELVLYTGLVVTTLAAAEATGNLDFWDAATAAAATSDDPVGTLWRLMDAADWAADAVRIWHTLYGAIGIENAYLSTVEYYADQNPA